jgi:aromatic-L-amino-acid/L-tryptophan decarboxylase
MIFLFTTFAEIMQKKFMNKNFTGDITSEEFSDISAKVSTWVREYLNNIEKYPVLSKLKPGDILRQIPTDAPEEGESFDKILKDLDNIILPGITHWNHPGFMAYFNSTSCSPGIFAEFVIAALNVNGMLWKTSPAATELEIGVLRWLRQMTGLDDSFEGIIYDTASVSSMHAIAAAREKAGYNIRQKGMSGRNDLPLLRLYCSEFAHSSIEKGALTLGIGLDGIVKIKVDDQFRLDTSELERVIQADKQNGHSPFCVVATVGTTSVTSIDPVPEIAEICKKYKLWLHVDAAYSGNAAVLPELRWILNGTENADSVVINPHKWMFTPIDFSAFYLKDKTVLRDAFSLIPEYLRTSDIAENFMDYGIQLGRRFRSLKLWFIIKYFGVEGIKNRIRENIRLAKEFEKWIDQNSSFIKMAPVYFGTVCFRAVKEGLNKEELNKLNERLMNEVNSTGKIFISHTKLNDYFVLRLVTSGLRTEERHMRMAAEIIEKTLND